MAVEAVPGAVVDRTLGAAVTPGVVAVGTRLAGEVDTSVAEVGTSAAAATLVEVADTEAVIIAKSQIPSHKSGRSFELCRSSISVNLAPNSEAPQSRSGTL